MLSRLVLIVVLWCAFSFGLSSKTELQLVGPRAGVGYLFDDANANLAEGLHSAFGWQVEIPYRSGDFTGYGEAGLMLLGAEQGILWPSAWGFFGFSYKNMGVGAGPVANPLGIGIGFGPYYQILTPTLRIPIGCNIELIDGNTRLQFLVGFSLR